MTDAELSTLWLATLFGGLCVAGGLSRLGLPRTHVRDLLHVGAGVWPLGWPFWRSPVAPVAIAFAAFLGMLAVPLLAPRLSWLARAQASVCGEGERWSGLVVYTGSVAVLTPVGLLGPRFPAAGALLALALGDGLGGAVGLRLGGRGFSAPGGKAKTFAGSTAVAAFSMLGVALAAQWFDARVGLATVAAAGVVAAVAEALSPRASDNAVLPAAVFAMLTLT
jgi:dolichol kinase